MGKIFKRQDQIIKELIECLGTETAARSVHDILEECRQIWKGQGKHANSDKNSFKPHTCSVCNKMTKTKEHVHFYADDTNTHSLTIYNLNGTQHKHQTYPSWQGTQKFYLFR